MLDTNQRQEVTYFTGYEVEHTRCHGMKTLFVVGTPPLEEILQQANRDIEIKHIIFFEPEFLFNDFLSFKDEILLVLI